METPEGEDGGEVLLRNLLEEVDSLLEGRVLLVHQIGVVGAEPGPHPVDAEEELGEYVTHVRLYTP